MADPLTGREILVGLKKAATWGTAVACGANDGLLISSETIKQVFDELLDDSLGQMWPKYSDRGKRNVAGTIDGYMRYEGFDVALALIAGVAGAPTQQGVTAAYINTYALADNILGLFGTLPMLKKSDIVFEVPSAKLFGFTLGGEMNSPCTISLNIVGNQQIRDSVVNTDVTMANITYPDVENRLIMNSDTHFWINDKSGIALASGDAVCPSSFEFTFNRQEEGDFTVCNAGVSEPGGVAFPEATLTLNFPRYDDTNDAFFDDWDGDTLKKMEILFTGGLIEDTYYYEFKISMPHLRVLNPDAPVSGPGKIPASLSFRVLGTDSAPTGMAVTNPFQVDIQNTRTTDPLA